MTTNAPRLSIVIPCFNSEATIGAQLSALATQATKYPWEVLISDNGSRDKTLAIAASFHDRIERLKIIDASARRGAGLRAAPVRKPLPANRSSFATQTT